MIDIVGTSSQIYIFAMMLPFGIIGGFLWIVADKYLKKISTYAIRIIFDALTTLIIGTIYIGGDLIVESGQYHFYTMISFVLGIYLCLIINKSIGAKIKAFLSSKFKKKSVEQGIDAVKT